MEKRWMGALVALALLMVGATPSLATGVRHEPRPYVGGPGDVTALCDVTGFGVGVGGTCLGIEPTERRVLLWIEDATGTSVGGYFRFLAEDGATIRTGTFCGRGNPIIPAGAVEIQILVDEVFGLNDCPVNAIVGQTGVGTAGTIHAFFLEAA